MAKWAEYTSSIDAVLTQSGRDDLEDGGKNVAMHHLQGTILPIRLNMLPHPTAQAGPG